MEAIDSARICVARKTERVLDKHKAEGEATRNNYSNMGKTDNSDTPNSKQTKASRKDGL